MTAPLPIGIVGAGRHATALAEYAAPLGGAVVSMVAPSPDGRDRTATASLTKQLGAAFQREWRSVAGDPSLPVVLVAGDDAQRDMVAEASLAAGKIVVCPAPAATTREALDRLSAAQARGGGLLLISGEIRHTPAGARAVALAADGSLGALHSIYAAVRLPTPDGRRHAPAILDRVGWDVVDAVCAAVPHPPTRVHATAAGLFGAAGDTAVVIARLGDTIATLELSSCLPASIPTVPQGEAEMELIGSREALRIEPYRTAVQLYGMRDAARLPWIDEPVLSMLREAVRVAAGETARTTAIEHWRRVVAFMDAVKTAAARSDALDPSADR